MLYRCEALVVINQKVAGTNKLESTGYSALPSPPRLMQRTHTAWQQASQYLLCSLSGGKGNTRTWRSRWWRCGINVSWGSRGWRSTVCSSTTTWDLAATGRLRLRRSRHHCRSARLDAASRVMWSGTGTDHQRPRSCARWPRQVVFHYTAVVIRRRICNKQYFHCILHGLLQRPAYALYSRCSVSCNFRIVVLVSLQIHHLIL